MTLKFFTGMYKQAALRLLITVFLMTLTFALSITTASAEVKNNSKSQDISLVSIHEWFDKQIVLHENKHWEQDVLNLIQTNINNIGGVKEALSDKQVRCLAENVYYESRGEGLAGQVAVAKVTLNRLDEGYAKTVCGVVKQREAGNCQFSWVCNKNTISPSGFLWSQAVGVALVVLNESDKIEDPTNGATHFHATYINWQPAWKRVKDSVQRIGNHVFYRVKSKEEK